MPGWAWALIVGAVGGLLNSVVHRDINGIKPYVDKAGHRHLDPGAPGSVFIGAVVGWGVWVMNHPEYTASTPVTTFLPLLSSLLAGLGGGRVLRAISRVPYKRLPCLKRPKLPKRLPKRCSVRPAGMVTKMVIESVVRSTVTNGECA